MVFALSADTKHKRSYDIDGGGAQMTGEQQLWYAALERAMMDAAWVPIGNAAYNRRLIADEANHLFFNRPKTLAWLCDMAGIEPEWAIPLMQEHILRERNRLSLVEPRARKYKKFGTPRYSHNSKDMVQSEYGNR